MNGEFHEDLQKLKLVMAPYLHSSGFLCITLTTKCRFMNNSQGWTRLALIILANTKLLIHESAHPSRAVSHVGSFITFLKNTK